MAKLGPSIVYGDLSVTGGITVTNNLVWHAGNLTNPMTLDTAQSVTGDKTFNNASRNMFINGANIGFHDTAASNASGIKYAATEADLTAPIVAFGSYWNGTAKTITRAFVVGVGSNWYDGSLLSLSATGDLTVPGEMVANRFEAGYDHNVSNSMGCSNWFRSSGSTGWYSGTHGGGIYMTDANFVKVYGSKKFEVTSTATDSIKTAGGMTIAGNSQTLYGPNTGWSKYLAVGANAAPSASQASVKVTDGNLHLDPAAGAYATYLSFYGGTSGTKFGDGASNIVAVMGPDGDLWKGNADNVGSKYWHNGNDSTSISQTGFMIFPNNFMICWAYSTADKIHAASWSFTFPSTFTHNPNVQATEYGVRLEGNTKLMISAISTTGVTIQVDGTASGDWAGGVNYVAFGYI